MTNIIESSLECEEIDCNLFDDNDNDNNDDKDEDEDDNNIMFNMMFISNQVTQRMSKKDDMNDKKLNLKRKQKWQKYKYCLKMTMKKIIATMIMNLNLKSHWSHFLSLY